MSQNPHPETTTSTFSRAPIPNQRYQDWASGHAIGRSEGIREGQEASDAIHTALHRMAINALKTTAGMLDMRLDENSSLSYTIAALEAVGKAQP